jgi:two-component system, LytTR family, sensor kinase
MEPQVMVMPDTIAAAAGHEAAVAPFVSRRTKLWMLGIALGALLGAVDSWQSYYLGQAVGVRLPWWRVLASNVSYWAVLAALVPAVVFLAKRVRVDGRVRIAPLAVHCLAGVVFGPVHAALSIGLLAPLPVYDNLLPVYVGTVRDYIAADFLTYWAIVIGYYAVHYYHESQRRQRAEAQLQMTLSEARLEVLRSRMNPHFLFNTLNSISTLALKGDNEATVEMLARLSELLRVSLDERCPHEVSLARELELLDRYLAIQRVRFADRLIICQRIGDDTQDALVPSMILQPLAENAIRHGIDAHCGAGTVTIESERRNGSLQLRVSDSGPGFQSSAAATVGRLGLGLSNTRARLEQLYGERQQIVFGQSEQGGGVVTVTIPFHTEAVSVPLDAGQS